jgi:hypothetical protein
MAAGDFTVTARAPEGDHWVFIGTLEAANGTEIDFNVTSVLDIQVTNQDDQESAQVVLNSNNGTADTEAGSVYVVSTTSDTDTWGYVMRCII